MAMNFTEMVQYKIKITCFIAPGYTQKTVCDAVYLELFVELGHGGV